MLTCTQARVCARRSVSTHTDESLNHYKHTDVLTSSVSVLGHQAKAEFPNQTSSLRSQNQIDNTSKQTYSFQFPDAYNQHKQALDLTSDLLTVF